MPAIQVARTDTFEQQRQKINDIGSQVFSITQGGSDLSTGNLKLGNGSISQPSLAFTAEEKLGIFRPSLGVISYVSAEKNIFDISGNGLNLYKDIKLEKKILSSSLISILSEGQNYDAGSYSDVRLSGGTGNFATADITVIGLSGSVTDAGSDYGPGTYPNIPLTGGSGSGATANIEVDTTEIELVSGGSNYEDGFYNSIPLIGGSGSGLEVNFSITDGSITNLSISSVGSGYLNGDQLTIDPNFDGFGLGSGFSATIISFPGSIVQCTIFSVGSGYLVNDILTVDPNFDGSGFGSGFEFTVEKVGFISSVSINNPGLGYSQYNILSVSPSDLTQPIGFTNYVKGTSKLRLSGSIPASTFSTSDTLKTAGGSLSSISLVSSSDILAEANQTYSQVPQSSTSGNGSGATFNISRSFDGSVNSVSVSQSGFFYAENDTITISGSSVGGTSPTDDIVISVSSVASSNQEYQIYKVVSSGSNLDYLITDPLSSSVGDAIVKSSAPSIAFTVSENTSKNKYFIDDGNGQVLHPDLLFYSGNRYSFNISDSSVSAHPFAFSIHPDGTNNVISGVVTTLVTGSNQFPVADTSGILVGMSVSISSGSASLQLGSVVTNVTGNTVTISSNVIAGGEVELTFAGVEYTDGVVRSSTNILITINDFTPNLYYYCRVHPDMAGEDGDEALITVDLDNPKTFGSGFQLIADDVQIETNISSDILTGNFKSSSFEGNAATIGNLSSTVINNLGTTTTNALSVSSISSTNLVLTSDTFSIQSDVGIGDLVSVSKNTGNIQTSGVIKTTNRINVNDILRLQGNTISSLASNDIILSPFSGRVAKITGNSAVIIPSGTTSDRPPVGIRENGAIRFNTDTNQYEGYNNTTTSWSSLGGVRDIDGNTYILAELTAGANDNTLWFFNDNNNTLRLTTQALDFRSVKRISSGRLGLPTFTNWVANVPVTIGQYLKYRNNLYEVTTSGVTGTSGNEPTHTSGSQPNGTAVLNWYSLAVSPLEFSDIEEVRIGPNKSCPLIVNAEIKLSNNTISTLVEDLVISPNPGKKVVVNSTTHLAIPAGNDNQKSTATAIAGSIRYNTTISQFEGYSGSNWSSLGGVRDVDGNTYIIPETSPGSNENILYFYNNNVNTLQLTTTTLDFTNIDTITTSGLNNLALDTPLVTLNNNDTTIDNRELTRTFISTSKQYLDLGLSSGLVVDPVIRLDDQGDVYLNIGFGTGSYNGVKIFDSGLKEFELADYAVKTETFTLTKGTAETSAKILYQLSTAKGCQISVVSKSSSGKKSLASYNIIDNGSDIFHNEFGSLNTSSDGFTASFDITPSNETRITVTLSDDHINGDIIEFTLITQVYK